MHISSAKIAYAVLLTAGISYAFVELRGPSGIPGVIAKNAQVHEYELKNQQLHNEIEKKQERIQRLKDNSGDQDLEIRQKLKLARPGEKIYILEESK